uniref:Uncharacterized protein n=1 Tax=Sphaerodactylus townsendi TaxID=933632 RepID=A0ACB8FFQ2_9SAUR
MSRPELRPARKAADKCAKQGAFPNMEPDPADQKSLLLALSWGRDRLKSLEKLYLQNLESARCSLEDALGAVLQQEERLWAQARAERARLQAELTAVQDANQRAVRAGVAEIRALWCQLGTLHTRLLGGPEAAAAAAPLDELAPEAATLLTRSARLALRLTRAHFVPHPGRATLGQLQQQEQLLGFPPLGSPARAGVGHPDWAVPQQESGVRAGGKGGPCEIRKTGPSEPLQVEDLAVDAGLASRGEEAMPTPIEGAWEEERGTQRALGARGSIATLALVGMSLPTARACEETKELGMAPAALSAGAQGTLPRDPATLFHAKAVVVQEEGSEGSWEEGGAGGWRERALLGSRAPSARDPFPRWASVDSLGPRWGAPRGVGTPLGGSCIELRAHGAERGSSGLGSAASCNSPLVKGGLLGEVTPGRVPSLQKRSVEHRKMPGCRWWPAAWHTQGPPPRLAAPPPPCNQLVGQWGKPGSRHGQLYLPHGLHATPAGLLYVVDFGNQRLQRLGSARRLLPLRGKGYFDVAVGKGGRLALTNSTWRCVELYSARGVLLQTTSEGFGSPRGIALSPQGELVVADMRLGVLHVLGEASGPGGRLVRCHTVPGFQKPYLVATNRLGEVAVSERGLAGGCCVKVLSASWQLLRVLGGPGRPPLLTNPWGVSLDEAGRVLVADWGRHTHKVLCYPPRGQGWAVASEGLSSPRGVALLGQRHLVVADSMHHCLKTFQYC